MQTEIKGQSRDKTNQLRVIIMTKEKENILAKWGQQIKVYRDAIDAMKRIRGLADKFDGKVINKRFVTVMNEMIDNKLVTFSLVAYGFRNTSIGKRIKIMMHDRCRDMPNRCLYVDVSEHYIFDNELDKPYINADGRLVKDAFLDSIDSNIENLSKVVSEYQRAIDHFDEYIEKVEKINEEITALRNEIPSPMCIGTFRLELPFWY